MLATTQNIKRLWCKHCSTTTKHETGFYDSAATTLFALGFFTCGITWLLVPMAIFVGRQYACTVCGMKRTKSIFSSG